MAYRGDGLLEWKKIKEHWKRWQRDLMVSLWEILENKEKMFHSKSIFFEKYIYYMCLVLSLLLVTPPMYRRTILEVHSEYSFFGFCKQGYMCFLEIVKAPCAVRKCLNNTDSNYLIYHKKLSRNWLGYTSLARCMMKMVIYKGANSFWLGHIWNNCFYFWPIYLYTHQTDSLLYAQCPIGKGSVPHSNEGLTYWLAFGNIMQYQARASSWCKWCIACRC